LFTQDRRRKKLTSDEKEILIGHADNKRSPDRRPGQSSISSFTQRLDCFEKKLEPLMGINFDEKFNLLLALEKKLDHVGNLDGKLEILLARLDSNRDPST
jgi:hypothetical protein